MGLRAGWTGVKKEIFFPPTGVTPNRPECLIRNSQGNGYYSFRILTHKERGLKPTERSNARAVTRVRFPAGSKYLSFPQHQRQATTQPPGLINGHRRSYPRR